MRSAYEAAAANAEKVYRCFLAQGRPEAAARRDAEAWALGNHGVEVTLTPPSPPQRQDWLAAWWESLQQDWARAQRRADAANRSAATRKRNEAYKAWQAAQQVYGPSSPLTRARHKAFLAEQAKVRT